MAKYVEREIESRVNLCDASGRLNPEAVGWSRKPLHSCNLSGRWPRKKKWNFWVVCAPKYSFCIALANVDYLGLAFGWVFDHETREMSEKTVPLPLGFGCRLDEKVEDEIDFKSSALSMNFKYRAGGLDIRAESPSFAGKKLSAEIAVAIPENHETLNVVIPWNRNEFQFTSKQNTLPASGAVRLGDRTYEFNPEDSYAVQDFGRGVWPYRTTWNWASGSGKAGGAVVGLQFGGKWTDGTGYNENGVCLNGKLYKISEDMDFIYDRENFMAPWVIKTSVSSDVDLMITPFHEKVTKINIGFLKSEVHQVFGHFSGRLSLEGKIVEIKDIFGWSEEEIALW